MRRISALTLTAAAALLAACAHGPQSDRTATTALDSWEKQIQVTPQPDEIRLGSHATGLSGPQMAALAALGDRWLQAEGREILIQAPDKSADPAGAYRIWTESRDFLVRQGVPAGRIRVASYAADAASAQPVIVGFQVYVAQGPTCGSFGNLARSAGNTPYDNFGCALAANIAAQVANPQDLLDPRDMTPADAARRGTVMTKYRAGEPTSTVADKQASGQVSQVVN
jgi:pilus assembly protein CpaD